MITLPLLRDLHLARLPVQASHWGLASRTARDAWELVDRQMLAAVRANAQEGEAATEVVTQLTQLADNFEYTRVECGLVETALNGLTHELGEAQRRLRAVLDEAAEYGYQVGDDGSVTYPAVERDTGTASGGTATATTLAHPSLDAYANPHQTEAQRLASRIADILTEANAVDAEYARTLAELETTDRLDVTRAMWADAAADTAAVTGAMDDVLDASRIPEGQTPTENRDWWAGLEQRERDALLALFPERIGALDGLPAEVRDMANRGLLEMEYARISDQLAQHLANEPLTVDEAGVHRRGVFTDGEIRSPEWPAWNAERERLEAVLGGLNSIQARLDQTGVEGLPEAYLLGLSTEADGRAIIANGNPDTADYTAVYVPGTSADLPGIEGDITRMTDLWQEMELRAGGQSVSTITWLGYDAPNNAIPFGEGDGLLPDASSPSYAYEAAPALANFMDGIHASHQRQEIAHTTVIGHSYGSTVIGAASQHDAFRADDIIVAGSPGMLVNSAQELGVGKGHTWSMAASTRDDYVPLFGASFLGGDAIDMDVEMSRIGLPYLDVEVLPQVPSMESFGANIMTTDSDGHGAYWDVDENGESSVSLQNQARVALGQYDRVELE
ncbi:alpha/beta hydrolase [Streptomyces millisiae]|uniref:Alpha/beta hydrolase n=1 Tax=Streptomyces millisiae TaxID=3075542 RepID=A0ABU2LVI4_9ACTN|nr:alpha/beta hydrolase [Streptomyces sp. DSM 44918]MDT0321545.1 alpha/beta hydrolase [Streptomyces sp. DSM 44918]